MKTKLLFFCILILVFVLDISTVFAKQIEVKGKITCFEQHPLCKVVVTVKGNNKVIYSDQEGNFSIVCNNTDRLIFKAYGFVTKRIKVAELDNTSSSMINMEFRNTKKNLELAKRYGHLKPETLTHAFDFVDTNLEYGSYSKITDILQEKENRVIVNNYGVKIVGIAGSPLYMVDGSEVTFSYFESIPTTDIKSISILKNTASARYGIKGYGGVIEVITK